MPIPGLRLPALRAAPAPAITRSRPFALGDVGEYVCCGQGDDERHRAARSVTRRAAPRVGRLLNLLARQRRLGLALRLGHLRGAEARLPGSVVNGGTDEQGRSTCDNIRKC